MQLLAACDRKLQLGPAPLIEIELERNHRHALALDRLRKARQLTLRYEQLALAPRLVIEAISREIFGNIGVDKPKLPALHRGVGFLDVGAPLAQRLHLGAVQDQTGLESVHNLISEPR